VRLAFTPTIVLYLDLTPTTATVVSVRISPIHHHPLFAATMAVVVVFLLAAGTTTPTVPTMMMMVVVVVVCWPVLRCHSGCGSSSSPIDGKGMDWSASRGINN
jgi:hypothetical protein